MTKQELQDKALQLVSTHYQGMAQLQSDRQKYLRYYNSDPTLYPSIDGRSKVITSDVHDVIEGMIPSLMDIFWGGSDVVKASPQGPEDELPARLMEELLNVQFQRDINGFRVLHDWFKSSLMMDIAWVKYWWEKGEDRIERNFEDLTPEEYQALLENPSFEIVKVEQDELQEETLDQFGALLVPRIVSFDVEAIEKREYSRPMVKYVPEEEIIHNVREANADRPAFIAHRKRVHKSELIKYKVDLESFDGYIANFQNDVLYQERFKDLGGTGFWYDINDPDYTYIIEVCLDDYDKKGRAVPKIVTIWGNETLKVEDNTYGKPNYICLSPSLVPGRMVGDGLAQKSLEFQDVSTSLLRSGLDNIYYQNLGMKVINPYRVEMDDLLKGNRPGGFVRTRDDSSPSDALFNIPTTTMPSHYEYMVSTNEARKENHTGVNKYSMGSDSREVNRTATGVAMLTSAAQMRTKHIARVFAETGVKRLFTELMWMNLEFLDTEYAVQINQQWQTLNKNTINGKYDIIIDVGIGVGTKELKANQMMQAMNFMGPLAQAGVIDPMGLVETVKEIFTNWGYKATERFVTPGPALKGPQYGGMAQQVSGQIPQGAPQGAGEPGAEGAQGFGGGTTPEQRIDPRVLRAVQGVMPQPLAG